MSKKCSELLLVLLFSVSAISISIAEENKKVASLDEAKTVAEVEAYLTETNTAFKDEYEKEKREKKEPTDADLVKLLRNTGEASIASGEKILKITDDTNEQTKGMKTKVAGLKLLLYADLIQTGQLNKQDQKESAPSKYQVILDQLIRDFEKNGQYPIIVNNELLSKFVNEELHELRKNFSLNKFEELVKRAKKLSLVKSDEFKPASLFISLIDIAASDKVVENNPQLAAETIKYFVTFINSEEFNLSAEEKKETLDLLERYSHRINRVIGTMVKQSMIKISTGTLCVVNTCWSSLQLRGADLVEPRFPECFQHTKNITTKVLKLFQFMFWTN
jgi:hypothetical protein